MLRNKEREPRSSVLWRVPVCGLRFCRRSHLHRVRRFALQRSPQHHIPTTAGAQAERIHRNLAEGGRINVVNTGQLATAANILLRGFACRDCYAIIAKNYLLMLFYDRTDRYTIAPFITTCNVLHVVSIHMNIVCIGIVIVAKF